jgi:site-specific recombinase XerD
MISILLPNEKASILAQAKEESQRDYFMILLALNTGLRNNELISLDICDLFNYGIILRQLELRKITTKGHKPRTIPLSNSVQEAFAHFSNWKMRNGESYDPEAPLFVSTRSKLRLQPRDFQRILKSISQKAIQRSVHPHVLRHTFATELLAKTNIRVVQELLGHKSISSTMIYTHVSFADMVSAINCL